MIGGEKKAEQIDTVSEILRDFRPTWLHNLELQGLY
jgi:hypothetical protein